MSANRACSNGLASTASPTTAPERLSGGQQRRLALAVQMLRGAEVLLLDEPTAGLDWSVRRDVLDLLAGLAREQVLIVVTPNPSCFRTGTAKDCACRAAARTDDYIALSFRGDMADRLVAQQPLRAASGCWRYQQPTSCVRRGSAMVCRSSPA